MMRLLAACWKRLRGGLQWRILWWTHATFMVGVYGVVRNERGDVLLLKHRFWKTRAWGLPGGYMQRGETPEAAWAREIREEVDGAVDAIRVERVTGGFRLRLEIALSACWTGPALPRPDGGEIVEAAFFAPGELPDDLLESHRRLIQEITACPTPPTLP